jgi:hypothetical protein
MMHTSASALTVPETLGPGAKVIRSKPLPDRNGHYPGWIVLCERGGDEYVVWTAYFNDEMDVWGVQTGDYFPVFDGDSDAAFAKAVARYMERSF